MRDALWEVLMNVGAVPLGLVDYLLGALAKLIQVLADIVYDLRGAWVERVRLWSGRTRSGKTKEQVAAEKARREKLVAELRHAVEVSASARQPDTTEDQP